jgi:hypothetical protein
MPRRALNSVLLCKECHILSLHALSHFYHPLEKTHLRRQSHSSLDNSSVSVALYHTEKTKVLI